MIMHGNHVSGMSLAGRLANESRRIDSTRSPGGLNEERGRKRNGKRTPPFLRPRGSTGPFSFLRATVDNWNRTHELVVRVQSL